MEALNEAESPLAMKKSLYEKNGVAVCSHNKSIFITVLILVTIFFASIIIAYTGPQSECTCAGEKPANFVDDDFDTSKPFVPIATNGQIFPWNNIRLPNFVRPLRYNITLRPNLTTLEVKGQVNIEFTVDKDTNFIVLHSRKIVILDKLVQDKKGHHLKVSSLLEYRSAEQIYLEIKDKFKRKENYTLSLRYSTYLGRSGDGFSLSNFLSPTGDAWTMAATYFYPTYARTTFPCFDEPQLKARFRVSVFRDRFHIVLTNMPIVNTEDTGFYMGTGLLRDIFHESPEMSTYMLAIVVCDYAFIQNQLNDDVYINLYAPRPILNESNYALHMTTKLIEYYQEFLLTPYPLPKQDLVAIPSQAIMPMNNWGLIAYSDVSQLTNPVENTTLTQQKAAMFLSNEVCHQWLGNLVSITWWTDLWLIESMCNLFEHYSINEMHPEWFVMDQFVVERVQTALAYDSLLNTYPIVAVSTGPPVVTHVNIVKKKYRDIIRYDKGAALMYMLQESLTKDVMQRGLMDFLTKYKYSNAEPKHFWNSFNEDEELDVQTIMETWTMQTGYPLVRIAKNNFTIIATQELFVMNQQIPVVTTNTSQEEFESKWYIPLTYYTNDDNTFVTTVWMNLTDAKFDVTPYTHWIKFNVNQSGFYRVLYDDASWKVFTSALKDHHAQLSTTDRANLIDDLFAFSRSGLVSVNLPLDLLSYLVRERDYAPWATALNHLETWTRYLSESSAYTLFLQYLRKIIKSVTDFVAWDDVGTHEVKLLRVRLLTFSISCDVTEVIKKAQSKFNKWMGAETYVIPTNIRELVYAAGVKYGGLQEWQHCWNTYRKTKNEKERSMLLKALGATADPLLLQRYLLTTLDRKLSDAKTVKTIMKTVAANSKGQLLAWRHLKAYWPQLQQLFDKSSQDLGELISIVTSHLSTPYDYHEVEDYFRKMNIGDARKALNQSLENIRLNINWISKNADDISTWLQKNLDQI